MSQLKMEADDNLLSCLKILENQGFEAEHQLLVQLFGCIGTYWNTPGVKSRSTSCIEAYRNTPGVGSPCVSKDISKTSLIEEGEILEDELFSSNQDLEEDEIRILDQDLDLEEDNVTEVKCEEVSTEEEEEVKQDENETSFNSGESFNDDEFEEPSLEDLFSLDQQPIENEFLEHQPVEREFPDQQHMEKEFPDQFPVEKEFPNQQHMEREFPKQHPVEKELREKDSETRTNSELVTFVHCSYCTLKVSGRRKGSKYFRTKLRKHNKTAHFVCKICRKRHDNREELDVHMKSLHKDIEGRLTCGVNGCDKKRKTLTSVLDHVRSEHDRVPKMKMKDSSGENHQNVASEVLSVRNVKLNPEVNSGHCKYCPFKLPAKNYFRSKLRMHNKTEHFVCEICRKKHDNRDELDMHMKSLHKDIEGGVICGVNGCKLKLKEMIHAFAHVRQHHDRVADLICKDCDKPYIRLKRHRLQHHRDPSSTKPLKRCTACGETFITNKGLLFHTRLKHPKPGKFSRKFPCGSCDFETSGLSQDQEEYKLIMHKRIHQSGEIICTMCPYKTEKPFSLKKHLAENHNIGNLFQCNQCDYKTGGPCSKSKMKDHMATHSNEKNFQCDQCEFSGNTKANLDQHMRRHNAPKYVCDKCEYKSSDSGNFTVHKQVKHGSVVLSCEDCDYSTKSRRSLREHRRKHLSILTSLTYQEKLELI